MTDKKTYTYNGHRLRLKEKYRRSGFREWFDYEILEFALTYAIPRKDTKPVAKKLIERFKNLGAVIDADCEELASVEGISEHTVLFLKLLRDFSILYFEGSLEEKDLLSSPESVFDYLKVSLKGNSDEEFKVIFLDSRNRLIATESHQTGTVNRAVVYPRKIVEQSLHHHAVGVIVAHNHPAGTLKPSQDDRRVTDAIKKALATVEIRLLDHIIIGGNSYFSFKQNGVM